LYEHLPPRGFIGAVKSRELRDAGILVDILDHPGCPDVADAILRTTPDAGEDIQSLPSRCRVP